MCVAACAEPWKHSLGQSRSVSITNYRIQAQKQDAQWAQHTWQIIKDAIGEIHRKNASHLSFEGEHALCCCCEFVLSCVRCVDCRMCVAELYRNSYNMVLYKYADLLYRNVAELIKSRLEELCRPGNQTSADTFHARSPVCVNFVLTFSLFFVVDL